MCRRVTVLVFLISVLGLASTGLAVNIVIVTDNPEREAGYEPFLKSFLGDNATVEIADAKYRDPISSQAKQDLENADLLIVSRQTSSGSYSADIDYWNGLKTPILLQSAYLSPDSIWRWLKDGHHGANGLTHVTAVDEEHLIFKDVTLVDGQVQMFTEPIENTDVSDQPSAGNGTKIATPAGVDDVMIASWEAGVEYYPGSGQYAGGPRMVFLMRKPFEFFPKLSVDGHKMLENSILILLGLLRKDVGLASTPIPADTDTYVPRDKVVLEWESGIYAHQHDVYFGTSFKDVDEATDTDIVYRGRQSENTYPLERLDLGKTYYWRIDEVNAPTDGTVFRGHTWSFTVEPEGYPINRDQIIVRTSSTDVDSGDPNAMINGAGLDENGRHSTELTDMWLSAPSEPNQTWIQYDFDKPYKLHEMQVWNYNGPSVLAWNGLKGVTVEYSADGATWIPLDHISEFDRAPGKDDYADYTAVDFDGLLVKHVKISAHSNWSAGALNQYGLSEVRFLHIPTWARERSPKDGSLDVDPNVVLSWRAGREAGAHEVYLGIDPQSLPLADIVSGSPYAWYDTIPHDLKLGQTYFWQINEVNEAEVPTTWAGNSLSFTTKKTLVVDDMESYSNEEDSRIFYTWVDGYDDSDNNGALVGANPPLNDYSAETMFVHTGNQSLPIWYNNSKALISEATRTFDPVQDWTRHGVTTLLLYFQGDLTDLNGRLYVKINNQKVVYRLDAKAVIPPEWQVWNKWMIDLTSLDVAKVTTLDIGIEGNSLIGNLYVDDIQLVAESPSGPPVVVDWFEAETADTLLYPFEILPEPEASGGQHIGTRSGTGDANLDPPADGIATYKLAVAGGTYKLSCRVNTEAGNSFWVRIPGATTPSDIELHASGWVRWNDPPVAEGWNWFDVFSDDDDQKATVLFTMDAGTYTLEIARREDGAWLDAIALVQVGP